MAQTQLFRGKTQVHLIEETVQDTYEATAGDGTGMILPTEVEFSVDSTNYEPNYVRPDFLQMDEIPGPVSGTIAFKCPVRGSGAAGTAPEFGEALKACGYRGVNDPGVSEIYTPYSTFDGTSGNPGPSYSVSILRDGVRHSIAGAFGNVVFTGSVDAPGMLEFTFQGKYVTFADDALEAPVYDTTIAPAFRGMSFATNFGGAETPVGVENFTLDTGNVIALGKSVNVQSGFYGARITGRKSTGSFDCERRTITGSGAEGNYEGLQRAGTSGTITTGAIGGTAGNIYQIDIGRAVLKPVEPTESNGIERLNVPFAVSSLATHVEGTNADITFTFT